MNIVVPQLGESVIEARVARWLKKEGDAVAAGDPLVELETDKIDLEVNAESAGVLARIDRKDGEDVKVGEVLGVIEPPPPGLRQGGAHPAQPVATRSTAPRRRGYGAESRNRTNRLRQRSKPPQPPRKSPRSTASTCRRSPAPATAGG